MLGLPTYSLAVESLNEQSESGMDGCLFGTRRMAYSPEPPLAAHEIKSIPKTHTGSVVCFDKGDWDPKRKRPTWGAKREEFSTKNGLYEGLYQAFRNGKVDRTVEYRAGKQHGWTKDFRDGVLVNEQQYVDDKAEGPSREYDAETGKLVRAVFVLRVGGTDTDVTFGKHGKVTSLTCGRYSVVPQDNVWCGRGGKPGTAKIYRSDGTLAQSITYLDGKRDGPSQRFDGQGKVTQTERYKNDVLEGGAKSTFVSKENGGKVIDDFSYQAGKKNGTQTAYFPGSRKKQQVITFKDDAVTKIVDYWQNGEKRKVQIFKPGAPTTFVEYDDTGAKRETGAYFKSGWAEIPDGPQRSYRQNGKLAAEVNFKDGKRHGTSIHHDEWTGDVTREEWDKGTLKSAKVKDRNGKVIKDEKYYPDGSVKK